MPENKEMLSKELKKMDKPPKDKVITIPGYNKDKKYKLHIKEVKEIAGPKITVKKAEAREVR